MKTLILLALIYMCGTVLTMSPEDTEVLDVADKPDDANDTCKGKALYYPGDEHTFSIPYCNKQKSLTGPVDLLLQRIYVDSIEGFLGGPYRCGVYGGTLLNNQCLYFSNSSELATWKDAKAICEMKNYTLAIPKDHEAVFEYIKIIDEFEQFWAGGSYNEQEEHWQWLNGEPVDDEQPIKRDNTAEENCLMLGGIQYYDASSCDIESRYICDMGTCDDYNLGLRRCLVNQIGDIFTSIRENMNNEKKTTKRAKRAWMGFGGWLIFGALGEDYNATCPAVGSLYGSGTNTNGE